MDIPWQALPEDTLTALIEEFVSREGTEYGWHDYSLADKVAQVRLQLKRGETRIDFDPDSETCNIVAADGRRP